MTNKTYIRFYKDHEVRAVWGEGCNKWWLSVIDIVEAINQQDEYEIKQQFL